MHLATIVKSIPLPTTAILLLAGLYSAMILIGGGIALAEQPTPNIGAATAISGALFLPTFLTGYWLSNSDEPPNDLLLAGHKITAAANLVFLNYTVVQMHRVEPLSVPEAGATIFMNLCFAGTIATGALMTVEKQWPDWVNRAHQVTPYLTVASSALLLLLLNRNSR